MREGIFAALITIIVIWFGYKIRCAQYHILQLQVKMGKKRDYGPQDFMVFGLGAAFTVLGGYLLYHRPNQFRHDQKDKQIDSLRREIASIREAILPKMAIEVTEAVWQHHKKNNREGYIWRAPNYGKSEGIGHTHINKDHKNFPLLEAYFERINNRRSNLALVQATKHALGNASFGRRKVLEVTYRCWGYDSHKKDFSVPLLYKGEKEQRTVEFKENDHGYLECRENDWLKK